MEHQGAGNTSVGLIPYNPHLESLGPHGPDWAGPPGAKNTPSDQGSHNPRPELSLPSFAPGRCPNFASQYLRVGRGREVRMKRSLLFSPRAGFSQDPSGGRSTLHNPRISQPEPPQAHAVYQLSQAALQAQASEITAQLREKLPLPSPETKGAEGSWPERSSGLQP